MKIVGKKKKRKKKIKETLESNEDSYLHAVVTSHASYDTDAMPLNYVFFFS